MMDEVDHPASRYAKMDFDAEDDWLNQFYKSKSLIMGIVQVLTAKDEEPVLRLAISEMQRLLQVTHSQHSGGTDQLIDSRSPVYVEWETVNAFMHSVSREMTSKTHLLSAETFHMILHTPVLDPKLLSLMLSVLSALLPIIPTLPQESLDLLLIKLFDYVRFKHPTLPLDIQRDFTSHAGAVFIRLTTLHPHLLTARFVELHEHVTAMKAKGEVDNRSFRCLMEGLLLLSNEMKNFNKQIEYVRMILSDSLKQWGQPALQEAIRSPLDMARYMGLMSPPDSDPLFRERRYQMMELVRDFIMVHRRVTTPKDPAVALEGGYVDESGVTHSPASTVIMPHLNSFLQCLNSTYGLYKSEVMKEFHSGFPPSTVQQLPDNERLAIISPHTFGVSETKRECKTDYFHIQKHMIELPDNIEQLLVKLSKMAAVQFYQHPNLAQMISHIVVNHLAEMNSLTFRNMIKTIMKPLCINCPPAIRVPFLTVVLGSSLPAIVNRLDTRWQKIYQQSQNTPNALPAEDEDRPDDEIIEDEMLRLASRELIEVLVRVFIESINPAEQKKPVHPASAGTQDVDMEDQSVNHRPSEHTGTGAPVHTGAGEAANFRVTDFIRALPKDEVLYLLWLCSNCVCWLDSMTSLRCADLVIPLLRYVFSINAMTGDIAEQLLQSILTAINVHGMHEVLTLKLSALVYTVYELLWPEFHQRTRALMLKLPGVTDDALTKFDLSCGFGKGAAPRNHSSGANRKRRDRMKILISAIIGKYIGEQFKERVEIHNLPPLVRKKIRRSTDIGAAVDNESIGLCQLFSPR